jgi:3-hydroxy acid dehydrogenase/malonic semialdehyde reductase
MAESLKDKIIFVTGASAGIGEACAQQFAASGARLILAARRIERVEALAASLKEQHGTDCLTYALDVRDRDAVESTVVSFPDEWKEVDILLNNAGLSVGLDKIHEGLINDWERMIDTNVKGLLYVTKQILPGMVERNRGHIINIGSIAGHGVYPRGNVYCATKFAVRALNEGMIIDTVDTQVRVSAISPGLVDTEFSTVRFKGDKERADGVYKGIEALTAEDIADSVLFCATRPQHVNLTDMVILANNQASSSIVHRES